MGIGGPCKSGFLVEKMGYGNCKGFIGSVEEVGLIISGFFFLPAHTLAESGFKIFNFMRLEGKANHFPGYNVSLFSLFHKFLHLVLRYLSETEAICDHGHKVFKGGIRTFFFLEFSEFSVPGLVGHLLVAEFVEEGVIPGSGKSNGKTTALMVTCYDDEGLFGMLVVEIHGNTNSLVEGDGISDGCYGIIGVAGPVDLTALYHHEKTFGVVKKLYCLLCKFCNGDLVTLSVHVVGHSFGTVNSGINCHYLAYSRLKGKELFPVKNSFVTVFNNGFPGIRLILPGTGGFFYISTAEEVKTALTEGKVYFIIVSAGRLMGVEAGGSGMVNINC